MTGALYGGWAVLGIAASVGTTEKPGLAGGSAGKLAGGLACELAGGSGRSESAGGVGKSSSRGYSSYSSRLARAGNSTEILYKAGWLV